MQKILVKGALLVVTCDDADRRISGGDVLIAGNRIEAVGTGLTGPVDRTIDASGCLVVPGMVNTHHHLFQTLTRNTPGAQDCGLFDWLRHHFPIWQRITPEAVRIGTLVGLGELLLTGCTTAADHHYLFPRGQPLDLLDFSIVAAREVGMRFHASRGSMSLGESAGGLPPDVMCQDENTILADCERVIGCYHQPEPGGMTRIVLAPCSPFSVTDGLMKVTIQMAKRHSLRCHTHLAETLDEELYCREKYGLRPVALMEKLGWLEDFCWFAHAVHLNEAEIGQLAKHRTGVAHCPTSNMRLGSGIAPLPKLLAAGVPVGLGVDGSASNDSSDMVGELRSALYVHRVHGDLKATSAPQVLRVATRGGAAVLGRDDIGQLAPGKMADLAIFDLTGLPYAGSLSDPLAALLFCGASHIARHVLVNGEVVVADGRLTRIDERAVAREANTISRQLTG
jgi:8-oxoguanine deaminase